MRPEWLPPGISRVTTLPENSEPRFDRKWTTAGNDTAFATHDRTKGIGVRSGWTYGRKNERSHDQASKKDADVWQSHGIHLSVDRIIRYELPHSDAD